MSFTDKQQRFIEEYCVDFNKTQAAIRAGYSRKTAKSQGHRLLTNVDIRAAIEKRMAQLTISANETLLRVTAHATGTLDDFFTGTSLDIPKAQALGKMGLVKKFKKTINTRIDKNGTEFISEHEEIELYPADAALDKLMRYHGLYKDKVILSWRDEVIGLLRDGTVTKESVREELGEELATELFESVSVS